MTMISFEKKPLLTYLLLCYNQESYIVEAVEAALNQTYQPLEIIISDDCSSDLTCKLIENLILSYDGPHKIIFNKNKKNLGFISHINSVKKLVNGELVVFAAGDDISDPNRTSIFADMWNPKSKKVGIVYSNIDKIDHSSRVIASKCHTDYSKVSLEDAIKNPFALICSYAIDKTLWDSFPEFNSNLVNEDIAFPLRCLLSDFRISYVNESLVKYRVGVGISKWQFIKKTSRKDFFFAYQSLVFLYEQIICDLIFFHKSFAYVEFLKLKLALAKKQREYCNASLLSSLLIVLSMKISFEEKIRFIFRVGFPYQYYLLKLILSKFHV